MTSKKEKQNTLNETTIYNKKIKRSFFIRTCYVCRKEIIKEDYYKVELYDKHQRQRVNINVCYEHGKDLKVYDFYEEYKKIKSLLDEMSEKSKDMNDTLKKYDRKLKEYE